MSDVKILKTDGQIVTIPEANLENFRRLNGHMIKEIINENPQSYEDIVEEIEAEDSPVEEIAPKDNVRFDELMNSDKDVVIKLANEIGEKLEPQKTFNHRHGLKTIAQFIIDNQS